MLGMSWSEILTIFASLIKWNKRKTPEKTFLRGETTILECTEKVEKLVRKINNQLDRQPTKEIWIYVQSCTIIEMLNKILQLVKQKCKSKIFKNEQNIDMAISVFLCRWSWWLEKLVYCGSKWNVRLHLPGENGEYNFQYKIFALVAHRLHRWNTFAIYM